MAGMPLVRRFNRDCHEALAAPSDAPRMRVFAGHDISVLPVLHALVPAAAGTQLAWPAYATELRLDLLLMDGEPVVEVFLNDEPLGTRAGPGPVPRNSFLQTMEQ